MTRRMRRLRRDLLQGPPVIALFDNDHVELRRCYTWPANYWTALWMRVNGKNLSDWKPDDQTV